MKRQFVSTEPLRLVFPSFFIGTSNSYLITGLDTVSYTVKKPDNTTQVVAPSFDSDTKLWVAEIVVGSFQAGEWLVKATSDAVGSYDQYQSLIWGDYVDDIQEARQAAVGRWRIIGTQLIIYEDDGTTPFKTFDLKDELGQPAIRAFERDPV